MKDTAEEWRHILMDASNSSLAIRSIYDALKMRHGKISLSSLCKKANIPSKGYLSDVMAGKRILNQVYRDSLGEALGLSGLNLKYFKLLVDIDHEAVGSKRREQLTLEAESIRKSFSIAFTADPIPMLASGMLFEVFCAFGLFGNRPSRSDLVNYFGEGRAQEVDDALRALELGKFILAQDGFYTLNDSHLLLTGGDDSHRRFLEESLKDAQAKVGRWHRDKAEAHFESVVISVNRAAYLHLLQKLKHNLLQWQSELETHEADIIIRFNVQVYPLK